MTKHLALLILGLLILLCGIPAIRYNFFLGLFVMGTGAVLTAWAKSHVLAGSIRWAQEKSERARIEREQRKRRSN